MVDLVVLVPAEESRHARELGLELVPVGRAVLRADRSDAEDVDDPGPPVRPAVRRGPGRTSRPRDPPGRRHARLGGWRLGREDVALQDRQPADRQQRAEGREELEGVVADDLDLPDAALFGLGANLDRAFLCQLAERVEITADVGAVERPKIVGRERRQVVPHPFLGVAANQLFLELRQVGHGQEPLTGRE